MTRIVTNVVKNDIDLSRVYDIILYIIVKS